MQSWKIFSSLISFCLTIIYRYIYMYTCITSIVFLLYLLTNSVFLLAIGDVHSTFSVPRTTTSVQSTTLSAGNIAPSQGSGQTGVIVGSVIGSLLLIAIIVGGAIVFMRYRKKQKGMKNHFFNRLSYYICINTVIGKKLIFIWVIFWYLHRIHWVFRLYL